MPDVVAKLGRQVITYDDHRFVGDVGWRQDRQTFDAFSLGYDSQDLITANYNFVTQRNRIFAEEKDIDSRDHLLNLKYEFKTAKLVGYAYLLEEDNDSKLSHDTYGIRLAGGVNRGKDSDSLMQSKSPRNRNRKPCLTITGLPSID